MAATADPRPRRHGPRLRPRSDHGRGSPASSLSVSCQPE